VSPLESICGASAASDSPAPSSGLAPPDPAVLLSALVQAPAAARAAALPAARSHEGNRAGAAPLVWLRSECPAAAQAPWRAARCPRRRLRAGPPSRSLATSRRAQVHRRWSPRLTAGRRWRRSRPLRPLPPPPLLPPTQPLPPPPLLPPTQPLLLRSSALPAPLPAPQASPPAVRRRPSLAAPHLSLPPLLPPQPQPHPHPQPQPLPDQPHYAHHQPPSPPPTRTHPWSRREPPMRTTRASCPRPSPQRPPSPWPRRPPSPWSRPPTSPSRPPSSPAPSSPRCRGQLPPG
jgi:hypothetical protein